MVPFGDVEPAPRAASALPRDVEPPPAAAALLGDVHSPPAAPAFRYVEPAPLGGVPAVLEEDVVQCWMLWNNTLIILFPQGLCLPMMGMGRVVESG